MNNLDLNTLLRDNSYPGRGILLGRSADNKRAVIAYFIMGRSAGSRNRVFEETADGIRTRAFDESKMTDPALLIYHPVRTVGDTTIVTNGDQTDTIRDGLLRGEVFAQSLRRRSFEPDAPHYTPRISGILQVDGGYALSILKTAGGDPTSARRQFFGYESPLAGQGHSIHPYHRDCSPFPSFDGEPRQVAITAPDAPYLSAEIWGNLKQDNKPSIFVSYIYLESGEADTVIINKHTEGET